MIVQRLDIVFTFVVVFLNFTTILSNKTFSEQLEPFDVSGTWQGSYFYGDNRSVPFTLYLTQDGRRIYGKTSEPNTFGNRSARYLYANVSGEVIGQNISFTKTYDGTGGQSHSVSYVGTIDHNGNVMVGNWRIGISGGTFTASKIAAAATVPEESRADADAAQAPTGTEAGTGESGQPADAANRAAARSARIEDLKARFPESWVPGILAGEVELGWSREAVREALGPPRKKLRTPDGAEMWSYPTRRVIFTDGKVTYVGD